MRPWQKPAANRWGTPQIGHHVKFVKLANGFSYDADILDTVKVAKRYERQRQETLKATANLTPEQAGRARYGAWMQGRRSEEFEGFFLEQQIELHTVARAYIGRDSQHTICTCGLAFEQPKFDDETDTGLLAMLSAPGHIRVSDQALQTIFVIHNPEPKENAAKFVYFCQTCGVLGNSPISDYRAENAESQEALAELRRTHKCDVVAGPTGQN